MKPEKKKLSKLKLHHKLAAYCAYQERCMADIELFLADYELDAATANELIAMLLADKYLDELRYAQSVARGKFNHKGWGRIKITFYLKTKKIDDGYIAKALKEIDSSAYCNKCEYLVQKQLDKLSAKALDLYVRNQKIHAAMAQKGYEFDTVKTAIISLGADKK